MSFFDVVRMAFHNLWSRKLRTVLNILGVVLACVVLTMMLAGTRGVAEGFDQMINESEDIRRFVIYRSWKRDENVPAEAMQVTGEMSESRRNRLRKRLKNKWLQEHSNRVTLDEASLNELKELPRMARLAPQSRLSCTLVMDDESHAGSSIRIARPDKRSKSRLLFGDYLDPIDHRGILVGEFLAFQLGYIDDEEVAGLIGKQVEISILMREQRASQLKRLMESDLVSLTTEGESLTAMQRLVKAVDLTSLSARDKRLLRSVFSASDRDTSESDYSKESYTIRGIVRDAEEGERSIFDYGGSNSDAAIYMTSDQATNAEMQKENFSSFYGAVGTVAKVHDLGPLLEQVEEMGFHTQSSWSLIERIDEEIGRARLAIGALCLLILLISAVGISNTMVVSVLERTREFGILKALGAQDKNILQLMLMEGALTGLVGAGVSIVLSVGLAQLVAVFVRLYISGRIRQSFDASVFAFSSVDLLIVLVLAVFVCTIASILPALRAAKLDPVVAMRGK